MTLSHNVTIVGSCHWLTNCHKEFHLRCYNSSRSTSYSWLFYITYISFYNACILTRLNPKTKYAGFYIKYIHNKKAVKNGTVGNITLHMYFMYKPGKNFIPLPIWTQRCHYIETSPLVCNDINRKSSIISILINIIYHANVSNVVYTFLTVRNLYKIPWKTKFK